MIHEDKTGLALAKSLHTYLFISKASCHQIKNRKNTNKCAEQNIRFFGLLVLLRVQGNYLVVGHGFRLDLHAVPLAIIILVYYADSIPYNLHFVYKLFKKDENDKSHLIFFISRESVTNLFVPYLSANCYPRNTYQEAQT